MAKSKTKFFCNECGYESAGWLGRCPGCAQWNTFVEEKITKEVSGALNTGIRNTPVAVPINEVSIDDENRLSTSIDELDRVIGGGVVKGSMILIAGDPGVGKSTLMLMLSGNIAKSHRVLYVSGEESVRQIKMRAKRLNVDASELYLVSETNINSITRLVEEIQPSYLVVDSIQTLYDDAIQSAPGSVSQVRETTNTLMQIAKTQGISVFIVGHVTKGGAIAGPMVLEHMVDTVLYFEGERHQTYRVLRSVKNRFGSTNEIGVFEMKENGLVEVQNPSLALLSGRPVDCPGTAVVCTMEGTRPMLIEVQALVTRSGFMNARRMATGFDVNRLSLLLAVMEKRLGLKLSNFDVYVNVIGGIRITEPAVDMPVVAAILSSYRDLSLNPGMVFFGEVGLTGEIRTVSHVDKRVSEAIRLGFTKCIVPKGNKLKPNEKDKIVSISSIQELNELLLK